MATSNNSPFKVIGIKKFIPGIAWFFVVLTLVCIPGEDLPVADNWMIEINYDKLIHVGIFAVLAFLFMYPIGKSVAFTKKEKWHYFIKIALATVVWGYTTEVIQKFFIPGRSYDLTDWLADSIGGLAAMIFCSRYFLKPPKTGI
ncbi:VanZ family protein [Ferruginibacter sp. SUN106]|uniref:VanZ family protein n=1 Tax=Ferruginibacter sp. SUN106 TaxID=2978348 RepID=UPI003D360B4A